MEETPSSRIRATRAHDIASEFRRDQLDRAGDLRRKITNELKSSFARYLQDEFGRAAEPDPVLYTLLLAFADQIAPVHGVIEEELPEAVLDELLRGLDLPARRAHPAQTIVQFENVDFRERILRTRPIKAADAAGRPLTFALDRPLHVGPNQLVFAAAYDPPTERASIGSLELLPGARLGGAPLARDSAPLQYGATPILFLAITIDDRRRGDPPIDLSGMGFFIDTATPNTAVARALQRSPWMILRGVPPDGGVVDEDSVLVPTRQPAGLRTLSFARAAGDVDAEADNPGGYPSFDGPYEPMVWFLPEFPPDRRSMSPMPRGIEAAVRELLPAEQQDALDGECAWIQIPLDGGVRGVAAAIQKVVPHCMTASNVFDWTSEHLDFERRGRTVSLEPGVGASRHLVEVLDVKGETGERYVEASAPSDDPEVGRFQVRLPLIDFVPRGAGERADRYAFVRLLLTDAERASGLPAESIQGIQREGGNVTMKVTGLRPTLGGEAAPTFELAQLRFAEQLRTRDRVVTALDVEAAVRAFDGRVLSVEMDAPQARLGATGMERVERVRALVDPRRFGDFAVDGPRLGSRLEAHLDTRAMLGSRFSVHVVAGA